MTEEKRGNYLFCAGIVMIAAVSLLYWRWLDQRLGIASFINVDDIATVQFALVGDGFVDKIRQLIIQEPTNVPLFYLLAFLWIKLFGFSVGAMRWLPQLFAFLAVMVIGMIGKKLSSSRGGVIAAVLAGLATPMIASAHQFRTYSLLIFGSALLYLVWLHQKECLRYYLGYAAALLFLSYTHYFGVLVCGAFAVVDLWQMLFCAKNKKFLSSYIIYALGFLPYLIAAYLHVSGVWGNFWPPVPAFRDIIPMLKEVGPAGGASLFLFAVVSFSYLAMICRWLRTRKKHPLFKEERFVAVWTVGVVLAPVFVYSKYINPDSSLWVSRYFYVLLPFTIAVTTCAVEDILVWLAQNQKLPAVVVSGVLLTLACWFVSDGVENDLKHPAAIRWEGQDFEGLKACLLQEELRDSGTLVFMPYPERYFVGWELFVSEDGIYENPHYCCSRAAFADMDLGGYDEIYVASIVWELDEESKQHLEETFKVADKHVGGYKFLKRYVAKTAR